MTCSETLRRSNTQRSFRNKKHFSFFSLFFLVAKCSGKWNDSLQQLSTCSCSRRSVERKGEEDGLGGSAGCAELTAVVSGRKRGFRNASLSPLCLIIWMTCQCMTQRHLYGGWRGLLEMTPPNDACHWSSKLTRGDGGMLKAAEKGRGNLRRSERGEIRRCRGRCCYFHSLCKLRCSGCGVPAPALLKLFFLNTRCFYCDKWFSTQSNNGRGTQTYPSSSSSTTTPPQWARWIVLAVMCFATTQHWRLFFFFFLFVGLPVTVLLLWDLTVPLETLLVIFFLFCWPVLVQHTFSFTLVSPLWFFIHPLLVQPQQHPLFPHLMPLTADEAWYMYSAVTFFCPVIYAVVFLRRLDGHALCVCACTCKALSWRVDGFVVCVRHEIVADNWWGCAAAGTYHKVGRTHQFFTPPIRRAKHIVLSCEGFLWSRLL